MTYLKHFAIACLLLFNASPSNAQLNYDVYIGAGQSNFDGRGEVSDLTGTLASFAAPQPGTLIYYNNPPEPDPNDTLDQAITTDGFVTLEPGYSFLGSRDFGDNPTIPSGIFGPEVSFGSAIANETGSSNPVAIIKVSRGGTNLRNDWLPADPTDPNDEGGPLYAELLATITAATAELTANGDTFTIRGFIWHQGESDSNNSSQYETNFSNLMAGVRAHVGEPDLPFVIGELAQSRTSASNPAFIALQAQIASNLEIGFVSSVGLTTPLSTGDGTDGTHFDAAGQIELGLRYASVLAELVVLDDGAPEPMSELVVFDAMDGQPLDGGVAGNGGTGTVQFGVLAGTTTASTLSLTTTDIVGYDSATSSFISLPGHETNIPGNTSTFGVNSISTPPDAGNDARDFDNGEQWVFVFSEDVELITIDLSGQSAVDEIFQISSPAFTTPFSLGDGQANDIHDLGSTFVAAGTPITFEAISGNGIRISQFTVNSLGSAGAGLTGDFDDDNDVDLDDINHYLGNLGTNAAGETAELDLNVDGEITFADAQLHIETYVQTDNSQTGTFLGDLNLDGSVDVLGDAFILISSLGNSVTSYGAGDINLDGVVDVLGDAFSLIGNLGMSNDP